jgi:UPF0716 protein FxsA
MCVKERSMRFVLLLAILLGFPVLDLYATVRIAQWSGVPVWVWIALAVASGIALLRNERLAFRARTLAALRGDEPLLRGVVDSGRKVLAGILLLLPGVVSDLMAVALLMLPLNVGPAFGHATAGRGAGYGRREIDGEYRRLE